MIALISPLLRLTNVVSVATIFAGSVFSGFAVGLSMVIQYNIQADNVDYAEYALNRRAEGGIASLFSFVVKAGGGIGGAIAGYVLEATGYVANQAQTDTAKLGIITNVLILPLVLYTAAILIFAFGYNLNKEKLIEINETLSRRRAEKAEADAD